MIPLKIFSYTWQIPYASGGGGSIVIQARSISHARAILQNAQKKGSSRLPDMDVARVLECLPDKIELAASEEVRG